MPLHFTDYAERVAALPQAAHRRDAGADGLPLSTRTDAPLLSIVTVAFNSGRTIERTMKSVFAQTYAPIEYLVIDGGSSDDTLDIVRRHGDRIAYWHSARDGGISDAFNLGACIAGGRYVAFVNSDDWMSADQAEHAVQALERTGAPFVFGRLAFHAIDGRQIYVMDAEDTYWRNIDWRMPNINHPTVVTRRDAYATVGLFDVKRRIAMDYDWHLRAEMHGLRGVYEPRMLGHMSEGGICDINWTAGLREVREVALAHRRGFMMPHLSYAARVARGHARIGLHKVAPQWLVHGLHRLVNPRFRPSSAK